jgi:hypothetical protein
MREYWVAITALQEALRLLMVDPRRLTEGQRAMLTKYVDSRS